MTPGPATTTFVQPVDDFMQLVEWAGPKIVDSRHHRIVFSRRPYKLFSH